MWAALPLSLRLGLGVLLALVCAFLVAPILVVVATSFTGEDFVAFPPRDLGLRWYYELLASRDFMSSLAVSLQIAAVSAFVSSIIGTAAALALVRGNLPGREAIQAALLSPLALPGLVLGVAILQLVAAAGWRSNMTTLVLGHVLITSPYVVRLASASLVSFDPKIELAAMNLGATRLGAFLRVTLPNILPGVVGGALFAFIVSFEDVNVSLFLSSPDVMTLPVRIFVLVTQESSPIASAAGSVLTVIVLALALATDRLFGLQRAMGKGA
jgi:putative spermidine/putrescine transport system permease protein